MKVTVEDNSSLSTALAHSHKLLTKSYSISTLKLQQFQKLPYFALPNQPKNKEKACLPWLVYTLIQKRTTAPQKSSRTEHHMIEAHQNKLNDTVKESSSRQSELKDDQRLLLQLNKDRHVGQVKILPLNIVEHKDFP